MSETVEISFDPELITPVPKPKRQDRKPKDVPLEEPLEREYSPSSLSGTKRSNARDIKIIEDGLTRGFALCGLGLSMLNLYDGMVIGENAEKLAKAWTKVAENNPTVRKYLLKMVQGGDWTAAFATTFAVLVPIAWNHGLVDEGLVNIARTMDVSIPVVHQLEGVSENGNGSSSN